MRRGLRAAVGAAVLMAMTVSCGDGGERSRPADGNTASTTSSTAAVDPGGAPQATGTAPSQRQLTFADEFDGDGPPDWSVWEPSLGTRHEAYLTDEPANVRVEGGMLVIEAHGGPRQGAPFTSAMIRSRRRFLHGRFEARMKVPTGAGTWPAFWLVADDWPAGGEIDVMEHYAREGTGPNSTGRANSNLHSSPPPDDPADTSRGRQTTTRIDPADWHVYAVEWSKGEIRFFVDGEVTAVHRRPVYDDEAWPFDDHPEAIALDLFLGDQAGPVDAAAMPQRLLVDWVRVHGPA